MSRVLASRTVVVVATLVLASAPVASWETDCSSRGDCRVLESHEIHVSGDSEPTILLLEVTQEDEVRLTAINTRAYHQKFYTTKPATYVERGGRDFVPAQDFFYPSSSGTLSVDGREIGPLRLAGTSQLLLARSLSSTAIEAFQKGTTARIGYSPLIHQYGRSADFSLMGFTAAYRGLEPAPPGERSAASTPRAVVGRHLSGRFDITEADLLTVSNPRGSGAFVYAPQTRYEGVTRQVIWFVIGEEAIKLNGATHHVTPNLPFPNEAAVGIWRGTGIGPSDLPAYGLQVVGFAGDQR